MPNIVQRIRDSAVRGDLGFAIQRRTRQYVKGLSSVIFQTPGIKIHSPEYIEPDKNDRPIVDRIFAAYKHAKIAEAKQSHLYRPSSMWEEQLATSYAFVRSSLAKNDPADMHFFLANFGCWKFYHGVEGNILIRECSRNFFKKQYLKEFVFARRLKWWRQMHNNRKDLSALSYPMFGNQSGAYIDGTFIGVGSFFNEIYSSQVAQVISDQKRPTIAELGGGYGKFAYFILRHFSNFSYINFDLPETLCLATYYLMKAFPEKKFLLYNEEPYSPAQHEKFDFILMPAFEIEKVGSNTVDIFLNKNSLGEMTKEGAKNYLQYMTSAARYLYHINHEKFPCVFNDGEKGLLGYEYPIPEEDFKLLLRYPDLDHMIFNDGFNGNIDMDIFVYLFEKRHSPPPVKH